MFLHKGFAKHIESLMHSPIHNYIIPGLSSWMIGEKSNFGTVRAFTCEREHIESISPHSHRYDFECFVVKGSVKNILWEKSEDGDLYQETEIEYLGEIGNYVGKKSGENTYKHIIQCFGSGDTYGMKHNQIHSISFAKGSLVLFFEGPSIKEKSIILEPIVNGKCIPVARVQEWMFK